MIAGHGHDVEATIRKNRRHVRRHNTGPTGRVPEAAAESIPEMLASVPPERVLEMAANARRVWQSWFSQDVSFHRIVSWCEAIVHERSSQRSLTNVGHVARLLGSDPRMMLRFLRRTRWRAAA